jgi:hypothetical protein
VAEQQQAAATGLMRRQDERRVVVRSAAPALLQPNPNAINGKGNRGWTLFQYLAATNQQGDMTTDVARTKAMWYTYTQTEGATLRQQASITSHSDGSIRHTSAVSWAVRLCYLERQPSRHRKLEAVNLKILRRIVPGAYAAHPSRNSSPSQLTTAVSYSR